LSRALAELIALRGYARARGDAQVQAAWAEVAGPEIARQTRALGIKRGVLQVSVSHAALLAELVGYHQVSLLAALQSRHGDLRIRDFKFKLDSGLSRAVSR